MWPSSDRRSGWAVERGAAELFRSRCAAAPGQAPRGQQPHMADEAVADEAPAPTEAPAEPPAEPAAEPAEAPTEAPAAPAEATPTETGALCTCGFNTLCTPSMTTLFLFFFVLWPMLEPSAFSSFFHPFSSFLHASFLCLTASQLE